MPPEPTSGATSPAKRGTSAAGRTRRLVADDIQETIERLCLRIGDRFPKSSLAGTCRTLLAISKETEETARWIARPNHLMRWGTVAGIALLAAALVVSVYQLDLTADGLTLADFVQMTEAGLSELVLIGAGVIFLVSFENRRKRNRVVAAVNRLRSVAHIIDAHQLTKDPDSVAKITVPTAHSPKRGLNEAELGRYLNYCSEMLSLTGKLGFLYVQDFDDPVANSAANDLEGLTTGLSRKVWQKIMILHSRGERRGRAEGHAH